MAPKTLVLVIVLVACFAPAIVTHRFEVEPYFVSGYVYCDTCRCGYETEASTYMPGAIVRIECRDRNTDSVTYTSPDGVTDSKGKYTIAVKRDCGEDYCDAFLVKSADPECSVPNEGRDRTRLTLTGNNGMVSNARDANNMGFLASKRLAKCGKVLRKYQESEI